MSASYKTSFLFKVLDFMLSLCNLSGRIQYLLNTHMNGIANQQGQ